MSPSLMLISMSSTLDHFYYNAVLHSVFISAGVGRTGTFLAIDSLITLIERTRTVDVFGCVHLLRLQRSQMVQRAVCSFF